MEARVATSRAARTSQAGTRLRITTLALPRRCSSSTGPARAEQGGSGPRARVFEFGGEQEVHGPLVGHDSLPFSPGIWSRPSWLRLSASSRGCEQRQGRDRDRSAPGGVTRPAPMSWLRSETSSRLAAASSVAASAAKEAPSRSRCRHTIAGRLDAIGESNCPAAWRWSVRGRESLPSVSGS
jgi:hypothetical protein